MITQPVAIFLLVLVLILLGPVVFRRLKIPPVVGLIISGMAVGPYGLGLLARDASFQIFGEVGILYIMFLAAVEIDMFHLKRNYRKGLVFGLLSFLLPLVAGLLGSHWIFSAGWDTSLLIASMFASHTLVSYPAVSKFGLQNTKGAVIAVCGTIVAVLLSLLCLAAVAQTKSTGSFSAYLILRLVGSMVLYCAVVGWLFPRATRLFFQYNPDPVSQYIFILAMVFVASLAAKLIGLEAILGAFYAGLVLNPMIPSRSRLMKNIHFLGDAVFIPYFLIGVGMLINAGVLFCGWDVWWVAFCMSGLALGTKWLASWLAARMFRLSPREGRLVFGLTSGKAAATIAAVMVGYEYALLSENLMNGAVVMILICCIVASLVTDHAAIRIRMRLTESELEREEIGATEFARQVVSVSNPVTAEGLMRLALAMRNRLNRLPMTLLYVRNNNDSRTRTMGRVAIETAAEAASQSDIEIRAMERFDVNIAAALRNVAVETDATEIVIGMHRKTAIVDSFYGPMIEQLLSATDRMVVMARCFIPVGTVTRIVAVVPKNAEYETGFHLWVTRLAMLASNIEASITFISYKETQEFIWAAVREDGVDIDVKFETLESYDDFILLSGDVAEEDLLVIISARKSSISWSADLENLPGFLSRYFSRHNLMMIVPKQF